MGCLNVKITDISEHLNIISIKDVGRHFEQISVKDISEHIRVSTKFICTISDAEYQLFICTNGIYQVQNNGNFIVQK